MERQNKFFIKNKTDQTSVLWGLWLVHPYYWRLEARDNDTFLQFLARMWLQYTVYVVARSCHGQSVCVSVFLSVRLSNASNDVKRLLNVKQNEIIVCKYINTIW